MFLELMGRMEPGESFAVVQIPEKILTEKIFSLELVSITFCNREEHENTHFPVTQRADFPEPPPYEEYIEERRPRPLPVIHRRRTMHLERAPRSVSIFDYYPLEPKRLKRAGDDDDEAGGSGGGVDSNDLKYTAIFSHTKVDLAVPDLGTITLHTFAERFNSLLANKIEPFFLNLYSTSIEPYLEFVPKSTTSRTTGTFNLRLAANTRLGVTDPKFWICMGFPVSLITHTKNKIFFLTNSTNQRVVIPTESERNVHQKLVLMYQLLFGSRAVPDSFFKISFYDLNPMLRSTLTVDPDSVCNKNIIGTCYFFKFLFDTIERVFSLKSDFVRVTYNSTDNTIDVTRGDNLSAPPDLKINSVYVTMLFGSGLQAKLNLSSPAINLNIGGKPDTIQLQAPSASAIDDDNTCQAKILSLQDDFYNQHSSNDIVKTMAAEWPAKLKARNRAKAAAAAAAAAAAVEEGEEEEEESESRKRLRPAGEEEEDLSPVEAEKSKKRQKQEEEEGLRKLLAEEKRQQEEQKRQREEAKKKLEEERLKRQKQVDAENERLRLVQEDAEQTKREQEKIRLEQERVREAERERLRLEEAEKVRIKQEKLRLEQERVKAERIQKEAERKEKLEKEERLKKQQEAEAENERIRLEKEEAERLERERIREAERERIRLEEAEKVRINQEKLRLEQERVKAERLQKEVARKEKERLEAERERERLLKEYQKKEEARLKQEKEAAEAFEREQARLRQEKEAEQRRQAQEAERLKREKEAERLKQEQEREKLRIQQEKIKKEQEQIKKAKKEEQERQAKQAAAEKAEQERIQLEQDKKKREEDAKKLLQQQKDEQRQREQLAEQLRLEKERVKQEQRRLEVERENERLRQNQVRARLRQEEADERERQRQENERIRLEGEEAERVRQQQQPPPQPPPPLIVIQEEEDDDDDEEEEEEEVDPPQMDDFEIVQIRNPNPRPDNSFVVWNKNPRAVCGPVVEFPPVCTILLTEGEPKDYIADRGYCCILGLLREAEPKTVSNLCVVKNNHIRQFTLQFLSNSLTLFTLPEISDPAWIKLDVICKPYMM